MWRRSYLLFLIMLTACTAAAEPEGAGTHVSSTILVPTPGIGEASTQEPDDSPAPINRRIMMEDNYSFSFILGFDSINPIYSPEFAPASEAPLEDKELVLGVAWDGEVKAYPISVLRYREMVDDELAGIPTLVTW